MAARVPPWWAGRRVGQEKLPRTTADACTGSFMSGLLSSGPREMQGGADGLVADTPATRILVVGCACAALARTRTATDQVRRGALARVRAMPARFAIGRFDGWHRAAVAGRTADRPRGSLAEDRRHLHGKLHVQSPYGLPGARPRRGTAQRVNQERVGPTVTGTVSLTSTVKRYTRRTVCTCRSG